MSKYRNRRTEVDGVLFDSKGEAQRWQELRLLEQAGEIRDLRRQVKFVLQDAFVAAGTREREIAYIADFVYSEGSTTVVEDFKGVKTAVFKIKRKLLLFRYKTIVFRVTT